MLNVSEIQILQNKFELYLSVMLDAYSKNIKSRSLQRLGSYLANTL